MAINEILKSIGTAVIRQGASSRSIDELFQDMNRRATGINQWVLDNPDEVQRRLKIYKKLQDGPAILDYLATNITEDENSLDAVVFPDKSFGNIFYADKSRGIYLALNVPVYLEFGLPNQLHVKSSGAYAPSISVCPYPIQEGKTIELHAGLIEWD